jgi:predicted dehydrogenase
MDMGTHVLNNMLKFGGRCRSVVAQATTDGHPITPHDVLQSAMGMGTIAGEHITAGLQFESNVTGTLLLQHRFDRRDSSHPMELYGSEGRLFWTPTGAWWLPQPHFMPDGTRDRWESLAFTHRWESSDGIDSEDDHWFAKEYVRALDEGRDHECSGLEAHHVIEIMMAIFESAAYGTRVNLPQKNREHPLLRWRSEAGLGPPDPKPRDYGEWLSTEFKRLGR